MTMAFPHGPVTTFGTLVTFKAGIASTALDPTTPAVPASGTPITNSVGYDVVVYIDCNSAGGVTVAVGGKTLFTAPASGYCTVNVKAGQTITLTYSATPTWVWRAL